MNTFEKITYGILVIFFIIVVIFTLGRLTNRQQPPIVEPRQTVATPVPFYPCNPEKEKCS